MSLYLTVDVAADYDFIAPCLMTKGNLLQLNLSELKVAHMNIATRLEAPSYSTDEFVVEALLPHLVLEESYPGFKHVRTDL